MSDIQFEDEEELAALKSLGKKARSDSQEARLLLLRAEKRRIQTIHRSRNYYKKMNEEQKENRRKAQRNCKRRTGGRQVTPLFLLPVLSPPLPGPP